MLARHGVDFRTARRARGWSNATWLAGGLAIRVAAAPGDADLHREARLAALLPPEVGYPPVVELGMSDGHAWVLSRAVPGENLEEVWGRLSTEERARARVELWHKAEAVHAVRGAEVGVHARPVSPFYAANAPEAEAQVARLEARGVLEGTAAANARAVLARFWPALADAPHVLNHGDLAACNALWHGGRVSCLLDFEFAVFAPVELDANESLKSVLGPGRQEPRPLREAVVGAVRPALRHPGAGDRLLGYGILLQMWEVENELRHWDGRGDFRRWRAHRRLASLTDGRDGYYAPILARLLSEGGPAV